jgi:BioD-like phosphotransacetylase family protein
MEARLELLQVGRIVVPLEPQCASDRLRRCVLLATRQLVHMQQHIVESRDESVVRSTGMHRTGASAARPSTVQE